MASQRRQILRVALITLAAATALMAPIIYFNGPTDRGIRCDRSLQPPGCEILRSYLFGIAANSSFLVTESRIHGAFAHCSTSHFGRGSTVCSVFLRLDSGRSYPVLGYDPLFPSQGESWARQLNEYFGNGAARRIELINDNVLVIALKRTALPVGFVLLALALSSWLRRGRAKRRAQE